jgi:hypothetical protein
VASEKKKIPLECGIADGETRTRTGDTTIFRSRGRISLTDPESLQIPMFSSRVDLDPVLAICVLSLSIWALDVASVPNQVAPSRYEPWCSDAIARSHSASRRMRRRRISPSTPRAVGNAAEPVSAGAGQGVRFS